MEQFSAYKGFIDLRYRPSEDDLICEFSVEPSPGFTIKDVAEHIAGESSVGTWTEVLTSQYGVKARPAKVFHISGNYITVAYPIELFEPGNMPQILSSIAGNIFGMKSIEKLRLEDVHWPYKIMKSFKGPMFGIPGIRKLTRIKERPLVGSIIKPKLGLDWKDHAKVAYEAWVGGLDLIKDDENLTSQSFNNFYDRVRETVKLKFKAERETGEKKIYMPNVTAETKEMLKRAKFVKDQGNEYMMVDILTTGFAGLQTLRNENDKLKLVIHAHRAMHAALTRGSHGISMLVIADIARLIGVDQLHIGTVVGKMEGVKSEVQNIEQEIEKRIITSHGHTLSENWHDIKPVLAVASGGLHPGMVPDLMKILGKDIAIMMGGGVHGHPQGTRAGAAAARQAIDAVMDGKSLEEYARTHLELRRALEKWGSVKYKTS